MKSQDIRGAMVSIYSKTYELSNLYLPLPYQFIYPQPPTPWKQGLPLREELDQGYEILLPVWNILRFELPVEEMTWLNRHELTLKTWIVNQGFFYSRGVEYLRSARGLYEKMLYSVPMVDWEIWGIRQASALSHEFDELKKSLTGILQKGETSELMEKILLTTRTLEEIFAKALDETYVSAEADPLLTKIQLDLEAYSLLGPSV